jgi:hypothetical protein
VVDRDEGRSPLLLEGRIVSPVGVFTDPDAWRFAAQADAEKVIAERGLPATAVSHGWVDEVADAEGGEKRGSRLLTPKEGRFMTWPVVEASDECPAGEPGTCCWCKRKVGEPHARDCTAVVKRVEFRVTSDDGDLVGLWQTDEPHFWDKPMSEFHKNDSSWCADNLLGEKGSVVWEQLDGWEIVELLRAQESCLCSALSFELVRVVDPEPRRS